MLDPITGLSLASSVAQIADLTFKLFTNLHKYYRDIRAAPTRSRELRMEVDAMLDLITELHETFERNPQGLYRPSLKEGVNEFRWMLEEMVRRTLPEKAAVLQRLKWPFKETENRDFLFRIERFKTSFIMVMNISQKYPTFTNAD